MNKISIEAAVRVINAALEIVSEEQAVQEELRASIRHNMQAWAEPPNWEAQQHRILNLLEACEEKERSAVEHGYDATDADLPTSQIRGILAS